MMSPQIRSAGTFIRTDVASKKRNDAPVDWAKGCAWLRRPQDDRQPSLVAPVFHDDCRRLLVTMRREDSQIILLHLRFFACVACEARPPTVGWTESCCIQPVERLERQVDRRIGRSSE
jgi:hypothetical protein